MQTLPDILLFALIFSFIIFYIIFKIFNLYTGRKINKNIFINASFFNALIIELGIFISWIYYSSSMHNFQVYNEDLILIMIFLTITVSILISYIYYYGKGVKKGSNQNKESKKDHKKSKISLFIIIFILMFTFALFVSLNYSNPSKTKPSSKFTGFDTDGYSSNLDDNFFNLE